MKITVEKMQLLTNFVWNKPEATKVKQDKNTKASETGGSSKSGKKRNIKKSKVILYKHNNLIYKIIHNLFNIMPKFLALLEFQASSSTSPAISPRTDSPRLEQITETDAPGFML
jgi:hypothetical protein